MYSRRSILTSFCEREHEETLNISSSNVGLFTFIIQEKEKKTFLISQDLLKAQSPMYSLCVVFSILDLNFYCLLMVFVGEIL